MDDFKRELYMEAQKFLLRNPRNSVCGALATVLCELTGKKHVNLAYGEVEELFPEFYALHDRIEWSRLGKRLDKTGAQASEVYWWEPSWIEPRIRAIDCLLNLYA